MTGEINESIVPYEIMIVNDILALSIRRLPTPDQGRECKKVPIRTANKRLRRDLEVLNGKNLRSNQI